MDYGRGTGARATKRRLWMILSLAATLAIAVTIFCFSAQEAEDSSRLSDALTRVITTLFRTSKPEVGQPKLSKTLVTVVRKTAHMAEFGLLAVSLSLFLYSLRPEGDIKRTSGLAWLISVAYGVTDELHQLFVAGREGKLIDVCIDAVGAALGALLIALTMAAWRKRRTQRTDER